MSAWAIGKGDTMKRFLIFISSIMVLAFTACGNSSSAEIVSEGETRTSNNKDIQTETVRSRTLYKRMTPHNLKK